MAKVFNVVGLGALGVDYLTQVQHFANTKNKVTSDNLVVLDGGVTANNLVQCARLGMKTKWCGAVGKDDLGTQCVVHLKKANIATSSLVFDTTQCCWIIVDEHGEREIYVFPNASSQLTPALVAQKFTKDIEKCTHFHTEVAVISLAAAIEGAMIAKRVGAKVFVDVDGDPNYLMKKAKIGTMQEMRELLSLATVIKLSTSAAQQLAGTKNIHTLMKQLLQRAEMVAITLGNDGCLIGNNKEIIKCPGYKIKCIDSTGAGDAFMGGLSYAIWKGMSLREAGMFANACGAYACTQIGARGSGTLKEINIVRDSSF